MQETKFPGRKLQLRSSWYHISGNGQFVDIIFSQSTTEHSYHIILSCQLNLTILTKSVELLPNHDTISLLSEFIHRKWTSGSNIPFHIEEQDNFKRSPEFKKQLMTGSYISKTPGHRSKRRLRRWRRCCRWRHCWHRRRRVGPAPAGVPGGLCRPGLFGPSFGLPVGTAGSLGLAESSCVLSCRVGRAGRGHVRRDSGIGSREEGFLPQLFWCLRCPPKEKQLWSEAPCFFDLTPQNAVFWTPPFLSLVWSFLYIVDKGHTRADPHLLHMCWGTGEGSLLGSQKKILAVSLAAVLFVWKVLNNSTTFHVIWKTWVYKY